MRTGNRLEPVESADSPNTENRSCCPMWGCPGTAETGESESLERFPQTTEKLTGLLSGRRPVSSYDASRLLSPDVADQLGVNECASGGLAFWTSSSTDQW